MKDKDMSKKNKRVVFRWCFLGLAIIAFLWFALPFFIGGILNIGNLTGMAVAFLLISYLLLQPHINKKLKALYELKIHRVWMKMSAGVMAIVVLLVFVETACMIGACVKAPKENATAIVLGCRVYGERPSLSLRERMDAAYEYLVANPKAMCVVSGGQGSGEDISEAECMYRYLVDKGVDASRIYKEDKSTSTEENMKYSMNVIKENGLNENVAIVTSEYHAYRAGIIADECGLSFGTASGHTAIWLLPTFYVRELYAILAEWIL